MLVGTFQGHIFQTPQVLQGWSAFMLDEKGTQDCQKAFTDGSPVPAGKGSRLWSW